MMAMTTRSSMRVKPELSRRII